MSTINIKYLICFCRMPKGWIHQFCVCACIVHFFFDRAHLFRYKLENAFQHSQLWFITSISNSTMFNKIWSICHFHWKVAPQNSFKCFVVFLGVAIQRTFSYESLRKMAIFLNQRFYNCYFCTHFFFVNAQINMHKTRKI